MLQVYSGIMEHTVARGGKCHAVATRGPINQNIQEMAFREECFHKEDFREGPGRGSKRIWSTNRPGQTLQANFRDT